MKINVFGYVNNKLSRIIKESVEHIYQMWAIRMNTGGCRAIPLVIIRDRVFTKSSA